MGAALVDLHWRARARHVLQQQPLFATRSSLDALTRARTRPRAVMVGIGLCREGDDGVELTRGLPLDVLGLLLPAEAMRRRVGAQRLELLVADAHAVAVGAPATAVASAARTTHALLERIVAVIAPGAARIRLASDVHGCDDHARLLAAARARVPRAGVYRQMQAADVAWYRQRCGGLLKVGWTLSDARHARHRRDEASFDDVVTRCFETDVCYAYARTGRALDDRRPRAVPYLECAPSRRLMLRPDERPLDKLAAARQRVSRDTLAAQRKHLKRITRAFAETVAPLSGPLEQRLASLYRGLLPAARRVA